MLMDAAQTAVEQKDPSALSYVLAHCGPSDRRIAEKINEMMASFKTGK